MRLYQCLLLSEYIQQLEVDLLVLKMIQSRFEENPVGQPYSLDEYEKNRETIENHSLVLSYHVGEIRAAQRRNLKTTSPQTEGEK